MTEIAIWILGFILAIAGTFVAETVWKGLLRRCTPPANWLFKWPLYFFYRSGLKGIARTYKILIASIVFLPLAGGFICAALTLWLGDWSEDFEITAIVLGFVALAAAIRAAWLAFALFGYCLGRDDDPYVDARTHAARVFEQLSLPVHGRSGTASLADLRRAGLIE